MIAILRTVAVSCKAKNKKERAVQAPGFLAGETTQSEIGPSGGPHPGWRKEFASAAPSTSGRARSGFRGLPSEKRSHESGVLPPQKLLGFSAREFPTKSPTPTGGHSKKSVARLKAYSHFFSRSPRIVPNWPLILGGHRTPLELQKITVNRESRCDVRSFPESLTIPVAPQSPRRLQHPGRFSRKSQRLQKQASQPLWNNLHNTSTTSRKPRASWTLHSIRKRIFRRHYGRLPAPFRPGRRPPLKPNRHPRAALCGNRLQGIPLAGRCPGRVHPRQKDRLISRALFEFTMAFILATAHSSGFSLSSDPVTRETNCRPQAL